MNVKKPWSYGFVLFALVGLLVGCGRSSGPGADEPIVIKFVHVTAPATPKGRGADRFKELVEQRLGDRVRVEVYPSGQLMNDDDAMEALAFGEIQMIATSLSKFDRLTKKYQVFDLPFLFPNLEAVERFQSSPQGRELLGELADQGFLGLGYWHNGMKQFGAPRPLRRPEDARGLKFRIQESDVLEAQILQLGGSPQKMALAEVYYALQTGAVDAQENTWSNILSQKFYEVQPYITETNHGYIGYLLAVNPQFWGSLPEDVRTELEAIAAEVTTFVNGIAEDVNQDARKKIAESDRTEIVTLTPEQQQAWQEAMRPVWNKFEGEIGAELIEAAQAAGGAPGPQLTSATN